MATETKYEHKWSRNPYMEVSSALGRRVVVGCLKCVAVKVQLFSADPVTGLTALAVESTVEVA